MSKPKTKGATIGIRLPLTVDAAIRGRAEAQGKSVGRYLADRIVAGAAPRDESNIRTISTTITQPERLARLREPIARQEVGCPHPSPAKLPSGLWRCPACESVSTDRGSSWRAV